jgi:phytoene synthase
VADAPAPDDPCAGLVRAHDPDRHVSILYAPEDARPPLFALFAFAADLARIPQSVSEPALGEIRLEWWRGTLDSLAAGKAIGHPIADALRPFVVTGLIDRARLEAMVDGRTPDLYADAMPDMAALEAWLGATRSLPIRAAIRILGGPGTDVPDAADAAGHAGVALGLVEMLTHLPSLLAARPELLPADWLADAAVSAGGLARPEGRDGLDRIVARLAAAAAGHLALAGGAASRLPPGILPALLPLAPLPGDLAAVRRRRDHARETAARGPLFRQLAMWRAARRGRLG